MNIYGIQEALPALEEIGHTLDNPERMKLEMGLVRLTSIADADQLLFWGKIFTNNEPYYIAMGVDFKGYYAFPHKKFYYSTNNFIFEELPPLDQFNKDKVNGFNSQPFTGDPTNILFNIQGEQGQENKGGDNKEQEVDSEEEQAVKIVPKNFTQLDRLSYIVRTIEHECQIIPLGSFKMSTEHELRYNQSFKGFKKADICLKNFLHFRYPQKDTAIKRIESAQSVLRLDFLENIENESLWSIQKNTDQDLISIRSFLWPGYLAYHKLGTKVFGGSYFGNGVKRPQMSFYV